MIDIKIGKFAGFCFGVKRAIELVDETLDNETGKIYSIGPK